MSGQVSGQMSEPTQGMFQRVLLRRVVEGGVGALLSWRGDVPDGHVVQVYVNGALHDVVRVEPGDASECWLHVAEGAGGVMRVELAAVEASRAWEDLSHALRGERAMAWDAALAVVRDEALPVDSRVVVEVESEPVAERRLWDALDSRSGFGGLFGFDVFGLGTATGLGYGLGGFGAGAFGSGGDAWRWQSSGLDAGEQALTLRVLDGAGGQVIEPVEMSVAVERPAPAAQEVRVDEGMKLMWA